MEKILIGILSIFLIVASLGMVMATDPVLTVTSPVEGAYLDSKTVTVDASSDQNVSFNLFRNVLRSRRSVELCDNVMTCMDTFRAREGSNTVRVKVLNTDGESDSEDISFIVDTRAPRISRTSPRHNAWVNENTSFLVNYREDNLASVKLVYDSLETINMTCTSGNRQTCRIDPNLTTLNGQDILYHFELFDEAGNNATSQVRTVHVDTTLPVIASSLATVNRRRVTFTIEVEEENFDNHPKDIFTEEVLQQLWKEYVALLITKGERSMASIVGTDLPKLGPDFKITFTVPNKLMEDQFRKGRPKLINFLREKLNNYGIKILVVLNETVEKKFAYTPLEKYNKMKEINPLLAKLRNAFELDM